MTLLLEISGLRIQGQSEGHEWVELVKGVSLDLQKGEVLGLIGESGAGKSTIGLAALGYAREGCRLAAGSIKLNGDELLGAPHERLRDVRGVRVAYVAQSAAAAFNPAHRLNAQVTEAAVRHGLMSAEQALLEAKRLYGKLRLPNPEKFGERYPHQVSGGQLQRAMTAMAMVAKPHLIVFDEPTTALDVTTQIEVLAAIKDAIRDEGTAALYITHDLAVVAPDRRSDHGAALWRAGRGRADPADPLRAAGGLHARPGQRPPGRAQQGAPRDPGCRRPRCAASPRPMATSWR